MSRLTPFLKTISPLVFAGLRRKLFSAHVGTCSSPEEPLQDVLIPPASRCRPGSSTAHCRDLVDADQKPALQKKDDL